MPSLPGHQTSSIVLGFTVLLFTLLHASAPQSETPAIGIDRIPVCMNFSCRDKQIIAISTKEWNSVADWLRQPVSDAEGERLNIKKAIGWMEVVVGRHTPTHRDIGGDLSDLDAEFPGQLDCIDESLNTTTYLKLFEQNDLLEYHKVVDRAYRRAIFDQHWAGQIEVLDSGERWVVDSWFQNNGHLPYIQKNAEWEDINIFFTANLDSSQPKSEKDTTFFSRIFN